MAGQITSEVHNITKKPCLDSQSLIPKSLSISLSSYFKKCVYWVNKTQWREFNSHFLLMS